MSNKEKMAAMTPDTETHTLVPRLRFPEFRANPPWVPRELSRLLTSISNGITLPQNNSGLGLRVTRIETIADGKIDLNRVGYVDAPPNEIEGHQLKAGDILISNINSIAHIGKSVLINENIDVYHGMNLLRLQVDVGSNSPKFIHFSINTPNVRESIRKRANKAVNQASINQTELGRTIVPSPPLPEQQKIADCLTSLDDLITLESQKLDALKRHKKGLMQQLFPREGEIVPRLRFPEFRSTGDWDKKSLGAICNVLNNRRQPISSDQRKPGPFPYYGASGIVDFVDNYLFDERLVLIGEDGAKWGAFEKSAFIVEGKYWVNNHAHVLRPIQINDVLLENYLVMLDLGPYITGAAPPKLTLAKLRGLEICFPSSPLEQQKIADCLTSLDDRITSQTQKIESLKTHKKGLMQQLFPTMGEV